MTDLHDAIVLIERQRAQAMALVEQYDFALGVLRDLLKAGPLAEQLVPPERLPGLETVTPRPETRARESVRSRVLALMDEDDRDWSTKELIGAFERRGAPLIATNVGNSVRTALSTATDEGLIFRTAPGRYKSGRFAGTMTAEEDA